MGVQALLWIAFVVLIAGTLAVDLGLLSRKPHVPSARESGALSLIWVLLALLFNAGIWWFRGAQDGLSFLTAYLIEKALSIDNIFVFLLIMRQYAVPAHLVPKVLKWGILGAVILRAIMIISGVALLHAFGWISYVLGAIVLWAGLRMVRAQGAVSDWRRSPPLRPLWTRLPVAGGYESETFLARHGTKLYVTPLLLVLILVEFTDLIFAADSVPAVLAVTTDPFLAYSSNVFALLGMRSLYFVLAVTMDKFRYLRPGLALILVFVGLKLLLSHVYAIPMVIALAIMALIFSACLLASRLFPEGERETREKDRPTAGETLPESSGTTPLSTALAEVLNEGTDVRVGDIVDRVADRGFGVLLVLLALPTLIPVLPPGAGAGVGFLYVLLSVQMLRGFTKPWLPARIRAVTLSARVVLALRRVGPGIFRYVERYSRPRAAPFPEWLLRRIVALAVLMLGLILLSPLPFLNTLPALTIMILGFGLVNRDGVFIISGLVVTGAVIAAITVGIGQLDDLVAWVAGLI